MKRALRFPLVVRFLAAAAIGVAGYEHWVLYRRGYRFIPTIGRLFLLNVIASAVVAVVLVVRRDLLVRLAAASLPVTTLVFFALSRLPGGVFGFEEHGLSPSPQALITVVAEVAAMATIFIETLVVARRGRSSLNTCEVITRSHSPNDFRREPSACPSPLPTSPSRTDRSPSSTRST